MKINLTGVKPASSPQTNRTLQQSQAQKARPLDQNSKILFSNSLHYKIVKVDESKLESRVSLL